MKALPVSIPKTIVWEWPLFWGLLIKTLALVATIATGYALAWMCPVTHAEVTVNDTIELYPIHGTNDAGLRRSLSANGPTGKEGRRFDTYTNWNISWRYNHRQDGGICRIDSVTTDVKIRMVLPDWKDETTAPKVLRKRGRDYLAALTLHESGHRKNGVDAARDIDCGIAALPPQQNCDAMGTAANACGNRMISQYNQRALDYDRNTDHGRSQGARFP